MTQVNGSLAVATVVINAPTRCGLRDTSFFCNAQAGIPFAMVVAAILCRDFSPSGGCAVAIVGHHDAPKRDDTEVVQWIHVVATWKTHCQGRCFAAHRHCARSSVASRSRDCTLYRTRRHQLCSYEHTTKYAACVRASRASGARSWDGVFSGGYHIPVDTSEHCGN